MKKILSRKETKGLIICCLIAIAAKNLVFLAPSLGSTCISIVIGIVVGNLIKGDQNHLKGAVFAEKKLLPISIMFMGVTLKLSQVTSIGAKGIGYVAITMFLVISLAILLCRKLGFSKEFSFLMGAGNAVCGSSAIAATSPVVDAHEDEVGISVAIVNLMGTIFMFLLPVLAVRVLHFDDIKTGILIGGTLQSVGQVAASSGMVNLEVQTIAMLFKMIRVAFLGIVVTVFSLSLNKSSEGKDTKKKFPVPTFIIVFFILSILTHFEFLSSGIISILKISSKWLMLISMAGIGMRIQVSKLLQEGPKALMAGIGIVAIQILVSLTFIFLLFK